MVLETSSLFFFLQTNDKIRKIGERFFCAKMSLPKIAQKKKIYDELVN